MTIYAKLNNGIVENVLVADVEFINSLLNKENYKILARGGIGWTYDETNDVYIAPKPYPSWLLNESHDWQAPKPKPDGAYYWDEDLQDWLKINET